MIEKIEEAYIEKMSILEKHRGKISVGLLTLGLFIAIGSILKLVNVLWLLITLLITGIVMCIAIRIYDFIKTIKEQQKVKLVYILREYEKSKSVKIKIAIQKILKKEKSYNVQTIQTLLDKYSMKYDNKKDNSIENYKWLVSTFISFVALSTQNQVVLTTVIIFFICILFGLKKIFDIAFDYLLTNKINNNLIYDILVEIKLDLINKKEDETIVREEKDISYLEKIPAADEFNSLAESVAWGKRENKIVEEALNNTLYSLCVYSSNKLIGYGRIIGDRTIFIHIHDIMVMPEFQGRGIGKKIIELLLEQINEYKKVNPDIRTYLGASKDKAEFYEKFGFVKIPNEELGAGMILYDT